VRFFSPILEKEQGGYVALQDRPWLQPGWFMTGLKKKSQAGKGGRREGLKRAGVGRKKVILAPRDGELS